MATQGFDQIVNKSRPILDNPNVSNVLIVLFFLYGSKVAPDVPMFNRLFESYLFRFVFIFLIALQSSKRPTLSLIVTVLLVFGLPYLEGYRIDQNTNVHPSCMGVTLADIQALFGGDQSAFDLALFNSGVPKNIPLNDEFSPLIATYLINHGYDLKSVCNLNNNSYM